MIQSGGFVPLQTIQPVCQLIALMFSGVVEDSVINDVASDPLHPIKLLKGECQGSTETIAIIEPIRQSKLNWFASAGMEQNRGSEVPGVETSLQENSSH